MKRILLACFLLTATCTIVTHRAAAQAVIVSASEFTAKTNTMDAQLATGDTIAAKATFAAIHQLMLQELGVTKHNIQNASAADRPAIAAILQNQTVIYKTIWSLKTNLAANRSYIHTQLLQFVATF